MKDEADGILIPPPPPPQEEEEDEVVEPNVDVVVRTETTVVHAEPEAEILPPPAVHVQEEEAPPREPTPEPEVVEAPPAEKKAELNLGMSAKEYREMLKNKGRGSGRKNPAGFKAKKDAFDQL